MRDAKVIFGKLRIVVFGNVANPEIQKHIDDCLYHGGIFIFRGCLGSFAYRSSKCFVFYCTEADPQYHCVIIEISSRICIWRIYVVLYCNYCPVGWRFPSSCSFQTDWFEYVYLVIVLISQFLLTDDFCSWLLTSSINHFQLPLFLLFPSPLVLLGDCCSLVSMVYKEFTLFSVCDIQRLTCLCPSLQTIDVVLSLWYPLDSTFVSSCSMD